MDTFVEKRIAICKNCPIVRNDPEWGLRCDNKKYISPDGTQGSYFKKTGWKCGCGCLIKQKAKNPNNHCVVGKW